MQWLRDRICRPRPGTCRPSSSTTVPARLCRNAARRHHCFNDMYFFPGDAARAALDLGMRAALGLIVIDFPSAYASDADDYCQGLTLRDALRDQPLLSFCMAPHAPIRSATAPLPGWSPWPRNSTCRSHACARNGNEIEQSIAEHGCGRWSGCAARSGRPNLIAVHAIHLTPEEIALLVQNGSSVAHCPSSNLKFASGFAPVARMLDAASTSAWDGRIGQQQPLDLFRNAPAALLAKAVSGDACALPAHRALAMATLDGARALRLDHAIARSSRANLPDLTAVEFTAPDMLPCYDPIRTLFMRRPREVSHVGCGAPSGRKPGAERPAKK